MLLFYESMFCGLFLFFFPSYPHLGISPLPVLLHVCRYHHSPGKCCTNCRNNTWVKLTCVQRTHSLNPSPLRDINITFLVLWLGKKKNGSIWQVNDSALNLSQRSPGIQQVCTMVTYLSLTSPGLWGILSAHKTGLRNFCWVNGEKKSSTAP